MKNAEQTERNIPFDFSIWNGKWNTQHNEKHKCKHRNAPTTTSSVYLSVSQRMRLGRHANIAKLSFSFTRDECRISEFFVRLRWTSSETIHVQKWFWVDNFVFRPLIQINFRSFFFCFSFVFIVIFCLHYFANKIKLVLRIFDEHLWQKWNEFNTFSKQLIIVSENSSAILSVKRVVHSEYTQTYTRHCCTHTVTKRIEFSNWYSVNVSELCEWQSQRVNANIVWSMR